ncbi:MAG: DNA mismatch repair protein MutS [Holosporales bacterium]|jgi:DNA mismatch repair protein MutS|nr:DNA mismatch repair protein MutS [Holosporales bacterium]
MENDVNEKLTPMMQQYAEIKKQYNDCMLFFRLGDFYELFYDDAKVVSKELGLVLTKRVSVPMCGIPWHASEMYITKLVKNGYRVAICEQLETPEEAKRKRGGKATVERKVVRIITQGTLVESSMLGEKSNNFLLAISDEFNGTIGIAYADVSTGGFFVEEIKIGELLSTISKVSPTEIICADGIFAKKELLPIIDKYKSIIRPIPIEKFSNNPSDKLKCFFDVKFIDAFGKFSERELFAAAAVVDYISTVYVTEKISLSFPKVLNNVDFMNLDAFTRKSLELEKTQSGEYKGCLLSAIDKTLTSQGGRLLSRWLSQPLTSISKINKRLDYVEFFTKNKELLEEIKKILNNFPDLERALSRVLMNKAGPRDLKVISTSLRISEVLGKIFVNYRLLNSIHLYDEHTENLYDLIDSSIIQEPPLLARDGGFVKKGVDKELDECLDFRENAEYIINKLQKQYSEDTCIPTLKIKNNGILGYFIDISSNYSSKIPYNFIHKQTLASSMRYTTQELSEIANKIYSADLNAKRRELTIFEELVLKIVVKSEKIRVIANQISFVDVIASFASLAVQNEYVRPVITENKEINILEGRHPVIEEVLKKSGVKFIKNDYQSDCSCVSILTGPNMGGKSTYLRQNAIIVILAQIGSFVPAQSALIGVVDKVFSRVGASDDISSGKSTFMVEMIETASILCQATERSFIILDEIGRGTSTYDGLSIAWAVIEEIDNNIKARTIFATHYHELIKLKETQPNIKFLTVKVEEWNKKIIFLHKINPGFADKSYGINVAALAGFPDRVITRAQKILESF